MVQKNLVFVVGLSQRLAEPEVLRKHEYFGKFGKIHKVVINQSTSYAGAQVPSSHFYIFFFLFVSILKRNMKQYKLCIQYFFFFFLYCELT